MAAYLSLFREIHRDASFAGSSAPPVHQGRKLNVRGGSWGSVGRIDAYAAVRNGSGSSSGKVDADGTLRNSSGSCIGKLDGCTMRTHLGAATVRLRAAAAAIEL